MAVTNRYIVVIVALAIVLAIASVAFAIPDEFGGTSFQTGYAPYSEAPSGYAPAVPERVGNYLVR